MKISVFEKVTIPKNKEEKKSLAFYASSPHKPLLMDCRSTSDLVDIITNRGWSPSVFKEYRLQKEFVKTSFLVLDIDDGLTIEESLKRVESMGRYCVCLPTSSHSQELNKYRLIFPLDRTINSVEVFEYNMKHLVEKFPEADPSCINDTARFYFPCQFSDDGYIYEGELFSVKLPKVKTRTYKPKEERSVLVTEDIKELVTNIFGQEKKYIPECVKTMLKDGSTGLEGRWIMTLNAFTFTLALKGISLEEIISIVENIAPNELDSRDLDCIERAFKDGSRQHE